MPTTLGKLWRRLVLTKRIDNWSLTSFQQRLTRRSAYGTRKKSRRERIDLKQLGVYCLAVGSKKKSYVLKFSS